MRNKILLSLFLLFCLLFLSNCVQAKESSQDVYNYSRVRQEGDIYYVDYVRYNIGGKHAGTLKLTKEMYEYPSWLLFVRDNGGVIYYALKDVSTSQVGGFTVFHDYNPDMLYFGGCNFDTGKTVNWYSYTYDFENKTWGSLTNYSGWYTRMRSSLTTWYPRADCIIMTKNCTLKFNNKQSVGGIDYPFAKRDQFLVSPEMKYLVGRGFRLYLNDFNWFVDNQESGTLTGSLSSLVLNIYDFKTHTDTTQKLNILDNYEIQTDEEENSYIDILFTDLLSYLSIVDGDFLVSVISVLDTNYLYSGFNDYNSSVRDCYRTKTKYSSIDYWRYKHDSQTGAGILLPSDFEGNTPDPSPTPTSDPVKDAITDQTQKIEDQTNSIKENTEVSKNIFQQIIELPGKIIELLLNALKSLFIPSEDFFTNWLDDLNKYFGDAFGILYYPFQILIDFLNRVQSIDSTTTAIINIPEFTLNFMDNRVTIFHSYSFDFNSILVNETYRNIHTIYLNVVDVILWLSVVFLASKSIKNVIGGITDTTIEAYTSEEEPSDAYKRNKIGF